MKIKTGLASIAVSAAAIFIAPSSFAQSAQNANIDIPVNATITARNLSVGMEQMQNFSFNLYAPTGVGGTSCAYRMQPYDSYDATEVDIYRTPVDSPQGAGCGFVEPPQFASVLVSCEPAQTVNFSAIYTPSGTSTIHLFTSEIPSLTLYTMLAHSADANGRITGGNSFTTGETLYRDCSGEGFLRLDLGAGILVNPGAEIGAIEVGRVSVEAFY